MVCLFAVLPYGMHMAMQYAENLHLLPLSLFPPFFLLSELERWWRSVESVIESELDDSKMVNEEGGWRLKD